MIVITTSSQKFFTVLNLGSLEVSRSTATRDFWSSPEKACQWSDHWTARVRDTSSAVVASPEASGSSGCGFVRVTVGSPRVPWWQGPASIRTTTARANGTALSARRLESTTPLCPRNWNWYQDPPRDFRLAERTAGSRVMRNFKPMQPQELHAWLRPPDAFFVLELNRRLVVAPGGGESIGGCLETGRKMAPPFPQPLRDTLRRSHRSRHSNSIRAGFVVMDRQSIYQWVMWLFIAPALLSRPLFILSFLLSCFKWKVSKFSLLPRINAIIPFSAGFFRFKDCVCCRRRDEHWIVAFLHNVKWAARMQDSTERPQTIEEDLFLVL